MEQVLKVVYLVECGLNITKAIKKVGISSNKFYSSINDKQRWYLDCLKYINIDPESHMASIQYGFKISKKIKAQKHISTVQCKKDFEKIEKFLRMQINKRNLILENKKCN